MIIQKIRKLLVGDDKKELDKESLKSQSETLLKQNMQNSQNEKTNDQRKAKKRCKIKCAIIVAVNAMLLLILVAVALDIAYKKKSNSTGNSTECGQPPNVEHGWYSNTGITPGDVSIYKCKEGYVGIGDERIFCKDDGQWSKSTFVCMEDCQSPPDVLNSASMVSGVKTLYRCNKGFYPVGETTIQCKDGIWSNITFACYKFCGLPPEIPFSKHKINGNMSGAITSYQCQSGYVPVGHPNVVCKSNGEWSTGNFSCLKDCPNPADVLSSTAWKHANKSGVYASYQCGHGFYLVGESTIVCQDGVWSSVKFTCNKYCGLPPKIPFSTHQINGNMSGVVTTYQCDSGYVPVGHPNVVCKSNGEWSTGNFLCLKDCPNPADVLSSTAWKHANKSGVYASYQCGHGFYLVGESTIVCKDGVWSSVKFTCNKYCSSPPYVPHATSHTTGNMSAAIASYRCEFGYAAVGEPNVVCENNGKWSNVKIECLIDCGAPPTKPYAERYYTATYSGSKVIYNCESGYIRTGSPTSTCQSDGQWSMNYFHCKLPVSTNRGNVNTPKSWTLILAFGTMVYTGCF